MKKSILIIMAMGMLIGQVDYESQIQTIIDANCTNSGCHTNGGAYQGGLDLSSYDNLMAGSNNGAVVVPEDHANSSLWQRVNSGQMPPQNNPDLNSDEVNLIAQWIDEGALETPVDQVDLFFSEYIEGSGNNKALEIFNPTGSAVDLSNYTIKHAAGGAGWGFHPDDGAVSGFIYPLTGTLGDGDVFILAADAAGADILSLADVTLGYPSVCHFNGDDAIGLFKNDVLIDVIGVPTVDPGSSWDVAGETGGTVEHTLVRKATVLTGNTDWTSSAGTSTENSEWNVEEQNYIDNLGYHVYGTGGENLAPIANAGSDQTVGFESEVNLDGSGSVDPDGSIASYSWEQVYGGTVALSSDSEAIVTFTAPATVDSLSFTLTVTDDEGATGSATIYVKTAQGVSNTVFISEWAEGSSYNKYIEIYNGSGSDIDLSQYKLATCSNGCPSADEWDYPDQVTFASSTILSAGDVYIIAHPQADPSILAEADYTGFQYMSNGNDVFGLVSASTGQIIDIIGERATENNTPPNTNGGWPVAGVDNATRDHTLVRKSSISQGNEGDWSSSAGTNESDSEWIVYGQDNWDNLGSHGQNVNAPSVAITNVSPGFIADNTEIEITAEATPISGTLSNPPVIYYGTDGSLLNQAEMWEGDSDNSWVGIIDAQPGNTLLQFKVVAVDDSENEGESTVQGRLVASTTPNEIQEIHANVVEDQIVTIQGIVTIGSGILDDEKTRAYIQDESGRGLNLFDYDFIEGITRGDELRLVGYVDQYITTVEVIDFVFETLSTGNSLPAAIVTTPTDANSSEFEGTLTMFQGEVTATESVSDGTATKLTIDDVTYVQIWNTTGISTAQYQVGTEWGFTGIGSQFSTEYQLLVGYEEDIATLGIAGSVAIPNELSLHPVYPNPFNPAATIDFSLQFDGEINLDVYDINGRVVDELKNANLLAGNHRLVWDASSLPSGLYFIRLQDGVNQKVQKVMLLK